MRRNLGRRLLLLMVIALLGVYAFRSARTLPAAPHRQSVDFERDFFVDYRLRRDEVRSKEVAMFRQILDDPASSSAAKAEANRGLLEIGRDMDREMEIESLIKAKGFTDAVALIARGNLVMVVKTANLTRPEVAEIVDIGKEVTGFASQDISIIPRAG